MKKTLKTRGIAIFMALMMLLTLLPAAAFAEEAEEQPAPPAPQADSVSVATAAELKAALEAEAVTTITLAGDITGMTTAEIATIPAEKVVVLDMAGHSITVANDFSGRPIANKGTLTVTGNGTIDSSASQNGYGAIRNDGTLTIENGRYIGNVYADGSAIRNGIGSKLTVNGGYFAATGAIYNVGEATIYKGEFVSLACSGCGTPWAYALNNRDENGVSGKMDILPENDEDVLVHGTQGALASAGGAQVYVKGGTFYTEPCSNGHAGSTFYALYVSGKADDVASCVIDGGKFSTTGKNACVYVTNTNPGDNGGEPGKAIVRINGGSFEQGSNTNKLIAFSSENGSELIITSGKFVGTESEVAAVSSYVADGYVCDESGAVVIDTDAEGKAAKIGNQHFKTLQGAIDAAQSGDTVTLLKSYSENSYSTVEKAVTLDLGGFTLANKGFYINDGGDLTIQNGVVRTNRMVSLIGGHFTLAADAEYGYLNAAGTSGNKSPVVAEATEGLTSTVDIYGKVVAFGYAIGGNAKAANTGKCVFNIHEGAEVTSAGNAAIYIPNGNDVTNITGGTIKGVTGVAIRGGTLNVSGNPTIVGDYTYDGTYYGFSYETEANRLGNGNCVYGPGIVAIPHSTLSAINVNISGGTVEGYYALSQHSAKDEWNGPVTWNVTNGTFNATAKAYTPDPLANRGGPYEEAINATVYIPGATKFITGGSFSTNDGLDTYVADNRVVNERSGRFYVEAPYTPGPDTGTTITDPNVPLASVLPFDDVAEDAWYYDAVKAVYEDKLMSGTSDNLFSPELSTTRGMIVTILYRMEGEPEVTASASFEDVADGAYYAKAVAWGAANGVISGYDAKTYGPNDNITREQLAAILYRYAAFKGYDVSKAADLAVFTDAASISEYAVDNMKWAVGSGLVSGVTDTTLVPTGEATRAQVASMLVRFLSNVAK